MRGGPFKRYVVEGVVLPRGKNSSLVKMRIEWDRSLLTNLLLKRKIRKNLKLGLKNLKRAIEARASKRPL